MSSILRDLVQHYGFLFLLAVLFADSAGVPWPTEATLVIAGVAIHRGAIHPLLALLGSLTGAGLGSSLSYYLGMRMGPALLRRIGRFFHLGQEHLARVDAWFEKYGDKAVFLGRFIPFVRNLAGYPAGVMRMHFRKYLTFSLAGYLLYILFATGMGFMGNALAGLVQEFEALLWIIIPAGLIIVWFKWGREWAKTLRGKG